MKERIKSMSFWAGIIGSIILILGAFGVEIADETASSVVNAVCSLLVMLGIVTPVKSASGAPETDETDTNGDDSRMD